MRWNIFKKFLIIVCLIVIIITAGLIWKNWPWMEYDGLKMRPDFDVAQNIMISPKNTIFTEALSLTGYNTFLQGDGPYTVFVPTDVAYENLSPETKAALADPEYEGEARQVVLYHVVKGHYLAADIKDGMTLETVQGEKLKFTWDDGYMVINGYSYVEVPNVVSKNGVIHMTTNYLLPPSVLSNTNTELFASDSGH